MDRYSKGNYNPISCIWSCDSNIVYLFSNSKYNAFMYPFLIMGYVFHKYESQVKQYISKKINFFIIISFVVMLLFYNEDHYIYTTGISLLTMERAWISQLGIDIFRYIIGAFESFSVIIIVKKYYDKISQVLRKLFAFCGKKSLEIYILQCMIVSWCFSVFYSKIILGICGSWFNKIVENSFLLDFIIAPIITIILIIIILILVKTINKSKMLGKLLFGR